MDPRAPRSDSPSSPSTPELTLGKLAVRRVGVAVRAFAREAQFLGLYLWFRLMGPPRVLIYDKAINVRLLRAFGATVGQHTGLVAPITLHNAGDGYHNLVIGDEVVFNGGTFLDLMRRITLERGVSLGPNVIIMTHNAFNKNAFLESRLSRLVGKKPVTIRAGAGIKAGAVILHGVTVGEEALVAGGSVVNRDVPRRSYVTGVPAVVRRNLGKD